MFRNLEALNSKSDFDVNHQTFFLQLAKQVAHDIRSPVTALNALVVNLPEVSEDKRQFLIEITNRISLIANDLIEKSKSIDTQDRLMRKKILLDDVNPELTIRKVIKEKRLEYQEHKEVKFIHKTHFHDVKCSLNESELARVLSNLINNSVEALQGRGRVLVRTKVEMQKFEILIEDNGQGIPSDVLNKLGHEPVSFGKLGIKSGCGIGVFHAFRSVEAMGGELQIESRIGKGTKIRISFPVMIKAA